MPVTHISYNPANDPRQYLAQALQQGITGQLAHRQKQQFLKGLSPTLTPMQLFQKALQSGYPVQEAMGLARQTAQTQYYQAGAKARLQPKKTKIQELMAEGYSLKEARMIRDISHGLKPRASNRKQYDNMSDVEKMNFLSTLKQRAEGQYYGVEGGNVEPRQPKLLKWVNEELGNLPILKRGVSQELPNLPEAKVGDPVIYDRKSGKPTHWLGPEGLTDAGSAISAQQEQSAPDMRLDSVWMNLPIEQKEAVWENEDKVMAALDNGYTIEQVLEALGE